MVNFHDPAVVVNDLPRATHKIFRLTVAYVKLMHTLIGLYIWEFITTLDYEWSIFWGRRPYRWTIWIYSLTRLATLTTVILVVVEFNTTAPYICQALITSAVVCDGMALAAAELLIVLRILAKLAPSVPSLPNRLASHHARWLAPPAHTRSGHAFSGTAPVETGPVAVLSRCADLRFADVFSVPACKGIIWFLIATASGALPTIFLCLDLNGRGFSTSSQSTKRLIELHFSQKISDAWSIMFQIPWMISISVAATRMYRSLTDFVTGVQIRMAFFSVPFPALTMLPVSCSAEANPQAGSGPTSRFLQNPAMQSLKGLEVAVHSTTVWDPTAQMSDHGSYTSTDGPVTPNRTD
ncbi:hypothetical protein BC826DRAFT_1120066 [Russula brevipes]|nr:hypothetical protein BC826DRAFT_1120066 [Russula brevipes]